MSLKRLKIAGMIVAALAIASLAPAAPNTGSPLGMNVSVPCDFGTVIPWVDMMMWMRGFEVNGTAGFPAAQLDSNGWVKYLNTGEEACVGHGSGTEGHFPGGDYTLLWEGDGVIGVRGAGAQMVSYDSAAHRGVVRVDSTQAWWGIKITKTNPADYVRNIRLIMPGFENTWRTDPWHPSFIKALERFKTLRFMDWGATNASQAVTWADMKPGTWWNQSSSDYRTVGGQVSPIWMIRLCNRIQADGWFCMPAHANDDLVRRYATLIRDSLAPGLKVYVEYSNEVWNWSFEQAAYSRDQAVAMGLLNSGGVVTGGPAEYFALRSSQIWRIFDEVFGTQKTRLEKVLTWQQGSDGQYGAFESALFFILANRTLNPDNQQPTAISIAPYFVDDGGDGVVRGRGAGSSAVDTTLFWNDIMNNVLPTKRTAAQSFATYARSKGMKMFAYEGGQHFAGNGTTAAFEQAAQRDPRMKTAYLRYLQDWFDVGGGMFCHYAQCGLGGQYGFWGSYEYYNQPRAQAPKYDALMTFIEDSIGLVSTVPRFEGRSVPAVVKAGAGAPAFAYTLAGERIALGRRAGADAARANGRAAGIYIVKSAGAVRRSIAR